MLDPLDGTILQLALRTRQLAGQAATATGLSRVATSRRIKRLADAGYLQRHGSGTRQTYSIGQRRFWLAQSSLATVAAAGESAVWERHVAPLLDGVKHSVVNLANIGFTEMLNNALEHSGASTIRMGVHVDAGRLQIAVMDDGIGIFSKIAASLALVDERLAVLELAKGKFTTAAQGHSGMGVFVTSRMLDGFLVHSRGLSFAPRTPSGVDLRFSWIDLRGFIEGTIVLMDLALDSGRTAQAVYERYFTPDEAGADAFHTTEVPVRLAQLSSQLVSRSQGKWVVERATQFRTVILDFEGVETVGQAFVDEVFRVFALAHPEVRLLAANLAPPVERLLRAFAPHAETVQAAPGWSGTQPPP